MLACVDGAVSQENFDMGRMKERCFKVVEQMVAAMPG
jgi:hypothetical protein